MSLLEIKDHLANLSQSERNDVKAFLHTLEGEEMNLTTAEIKELNLRVKHFKENPESGKSWDMVVGQWKK